MSDEGTEVGCRPMAEALGVFLGLFVVGLVVAFGSDPETIGPVRSFLFFLGAPATTVLQFISPGGFPLAWPVDVLVWSLASVWTARAADRVGWWRRVGIVLAASAVLALVAVA